VNVTTTTGQPATFAVVAAGDSLAYQWQRNGIDIPGETGATYTLDAASTIDLGAQFRVLVSGSGGTVVSDVATIILNATGAPTAVITAPVGGKLYKAGQSIRFRGTGTDPQDGKLAPGAFSWRVDFHHDDHLHPHLQDTPGKRSGSFRVPREGETSANVWFRIHLTVTDSSGLSHSVFHDIHPQTVTFTVTPSHPGLQVFLDGPPVNTPLTFEAVVGSRHTLGADAVQVVDGVSYSFERWSQSRKPEFSFTAPVRDRALEVIYVVNGEGT
jgi:hypothetical protein